MHLCGALPYPVPKKGPGSKNNNTALGQVFMKVHLLVNFKTKSLPCFNFEFRVKISRIKCSINRPKLNNFSYLYPCGETK